MSTAVYQPRERPLPTLDYDLVRSGFLYFAFFMALVSPFTIDPLVTAGGAAVPWLILRIVGTPTMPMAALYIFLWQWMQVYARVPQSWIDRESLSAGLYAGDIGRAYWYMLASLVIMACSFRLVLGNLKAPSPSQLNAHRKWQVSDLVTLYFATLVISMGLLAVGRALPAASQIADAASRVKIVALFMLFAYCMSTGRGTKLMIGAVVFEVGVGFTGFLSDFRGVFIYLAIAAMTARIKWQAKTALSCLAGGAVLVSLALFWTSVKVDYRAYVVQDEQSQEIKVGLGERMSHLGGMALNTSIDFSSTSYALLSRLAYTDIFGSVIGVQRVAPEPMLMRQWTEGAGHVFQPRFLFPSKAALSDTDVYVRLARAFSSEAMRAGTSISVGYMAENYADLGFPGMLVGVGFLGLLMAGVIRVMMSFQLPHIMREGVVMGFAFMMARDGVEVSLPKMLGAMFMFFIVFLLLNKFGLARVVEWLDQRAALASASAPRTVRKR